MRNSLRQNKVLDFIFCVILPVIGVIVGSIGITGYVRQAMAKNSEEQQIVISELPNGDYDKSYSEDLTSYEQYLMFEDTDWENEEDPLEEFTTVTVDSSLTTSTFSETSSSFTDYHPHANVSMSDKEKIMLDENAAWDLISGGLYKSYPSGNFIDNRDTLLAIQRTNTATINVKCWYWEDPSDDTNFNKVTVTKTFAVNKSIASLFKHAFEDIYNDPSKPIINIGDYGMGTWVIRGKNHNSYARMSTHSLGCCIDINPSTASFCVNGKWYGNAYGQHAMSEAIWNQLPECHKKYHVLYDGSPIVEIFKSYGFVWGGDWTSGTDPMHLSWIGEGQTTREKGQANYLARI